MKVTLAVPNYNGLENIKALLPNVMNEGFHEIFVLDDKSTDDSNSFLKSLSGIKFIQGAKNLGPAGNRNRILGKVSGDLILFIDADMEIVSSNIVQQLNALFTDQSKVLIGGSIITMKNEPMWWNYGYEMNPIRDSKADIIHDLAFKFWENQEVLEYLKDSYKELTRNLEITFDKPNEVEVDWVSEANFCVRKSVFEEVGGFDSKMRYHADQDLCKRIRSEGHSIYYNRAIITRHKEIDTLGERRKRIIHENSYYFYKKHWDMPKKIFDKLFPYSE